MISSDAVAALSAVRELLRTDEVATVLAGGTTRKVNTVGEPRFQVLWREALRNAAAELITFRGSRSSPRGHLDTEEKLRLLEKTLDNVLPPAVDAHLTPYSSVPQKSGRTIVVPPTREQPTVAALPLELQDRIVGDLIDAFRTAGPNEQSVRLGDPSLTCWRWALLLRPHLFRKVTIQSKEDVETLHAFLICARSHIRHYILRLDVRCPVHFVPITVLSLPRQLPRLERLAFRHPSGTPSGSAPFGVPLARRFRPLIAPWAMVGRLDLRGIHYRSFFDLVEMVAALVGLKSLQCHMVTWQYCPPAAPRWIRRSAGALSAVTAFKCTDYGPLLWLFMHEPTVIRAGSGLGLSSDCVSVLSALVTLVQSIPEASISMFSMKWAAVLDETLPDTFYVELTMKVKTLHPRLTLIAKVVPLASCINELCSVEASLDLEPDMVSPTLELDWHCVDSPPPVSTAPSIAVLTVRLESEQGAADLKATGLVGQAFPSLSTQNRIRFAHSAELKKWRKNYPERSSALAPTTVLSESASMS